MRCCLISGIFPPDIGGPATYVSRLATSLTQQGHDVRVVTLGDDAQTYPFPVHWISRRLPLPVRLWLIFLTLLRTGRDAEVWYINGLEVPAVLAGKLLRKRLVMKIVGDYAWERATNLELTADTIDDFQQKKQPGQVEWHKRLRSWYAQQVAVVITPSRYLKQLVQGWGVPEHRIQVVYNAVEALPPNLLPKEDIRRRFGFAESDTVLITVGRLVKWKGMTQLIEVVASCDASVKLLILGDGPEKNILTELAAQLQVAQRVVFGGKAERALALAAMQAADIFVLHTGYEGFSHVLLEAMQVGTPVITTNVCGNPELVVHGENGILIPYGDSGELKQQIARLIHNQTLQKKYAETGRRTVQQLTWKHLQQQTLKILDDMTSPDNKQPLRIGFIGGVRYPQPLDATNVKKFTLLAPLGELFVVGFSQNLKPRRFDEYAHFYLLPLLPLPILRYVLLWIGGFGLLGWLMLSKHVRAFVATSPYEAIPAVIAKMIARWFGVSIVLVIESHGDFEESLFMQRRVAFPKLFATLMHWLADFTIRRADILRAVSDSTRRQLEQWQPKRPVIQFFTWTDIDAFQKIGAARQPPLAPIFLYAGMLIPRKGVLHLVNAFGAIARDFPEAQLLIIGKEENPEYVAEVKSRITQLGCDRQVQFSPPLPQQELAEDMGRAGVFVLPTYSEGLPRVVFEAMSAGLPVIATAVSGIPEIIQDGITGFLVQPGDETALAEKMRWMLTHPKQARQIGQAAYTTASRLFSTDLWLQHYRHMFELVQSLLSSLNKA